MHHSRNSQILRQWRILQALSDRRWWSLPEIIDAAGVSDRHARTVRRDMEALMEVFPVERRVQVRLAARSRGEGVAGFYEWRLQKQIFAKRMEVACQGQ